MHKVDVMYEIEPDDLVGDIDYIYKIKKFDKAIADRTKSIKITEKVFDLMLSEGMLQKTDNGYVFVGKYEDVREFKNKKKH